MTGSEIPNPLYVPSDVHQRKSYFDTVAHTLSDARRVTLYGEINLQMASGFANQIEFLKLTSPLPINIEINSGGGVVLDGLAIYDKIMDVRKSHIVNVTAIGACMSMATIILQAGVVRSATPNAQFILHEISYGGERTTHSANKDAIKQAQRLNDILTNILANRANISKKEIETLTERRDYSISAEEALANGLIDKILS